MDHRIFFHCFNIHTNEFNTAAMEKKSQDLLQSNQIRELLYQFILLT